MKASDTRRKNKAKKEAAKQGVEACDAEYCHDITCVDVHYHLSDCRCEDCCGAFE